MIKRIFTVLFSSILLFGFYSCGEKKETPKLQYYKETPIQGTQTIFYRPDEGVLADVIPYYEDGKYYLYFLHDYRNVADYGVGVDWDLLVTSDFITYDYKGTVLRRGSNTHQIPYFGVFASCIGFNSAIHIIQYRRFNFLFR